MIEHKQLYRFEKLYADYRLMTEQPSQAVPKIIINPPVTNQYSFFEKVDDPAKMLADELNGLKPHLELEDDRVPSIRVQFGTAQVAAAFGCELSMPTDAAPCASSHVLADGDYTKLKDPQLTDGWFGKLAEFTEYFKSNMPKGVVIQHPDIQGPFNTAHLIRGNDILYDLFDCHNRVEFLLDKITDYMLKLQPWLMDMIGDPLQDGYFFDWGSMWKGSIGMRNCSTHLISPDQYQKLVLPRDIRLLDGLGCGRMHYCGSYTEIIDKFFMIDTITGLDYDSEYHDLWQLCPNAPENAVLSHWIMAHENDQSLVKLLNGDWPDKRNIVIIVSVESIEEGADILKKLRESCK